MLICDAHYCASNLDNMESRLGCDMAFGLKCLAMCFMSRMYLSTILKNWPPFYLSSFVGKVECQLLLMHITFEGIAIYGKVGYLGCAWLVVCFYFEFVWSMGFVDGFFVVYYSWRCGMLFVIDVFCGWWWA